jgi:hypothetical protein
MISVMATKEELSEAELRLWTAFPTGELVDFSAGHPEDKDPAQGEQWDQSRHVRAKILCELLRGAGDAGQGYPGMVRIKGARITGRIDLSDAELICPLILIECHIGDGIYMAMARTKSIQLNRCHIESVVFSGAKVDGQLILSGSYLTSINNVALLADGLAVSEDLICNGITASGELRLPNAAISGRVSFTDSALHSETEYSLFAPALKVGQSMHCGGNFRTKGSISLGYANIGTLLSFAGASLDGNGRESLNVTRIVISGDMSGTDLSAVGTVRLSAAAIDGWLTFDNAQLDGRGSDALSAAGIKVGGYTTFNRGFKATGNVDISHATIGLALSLEDSYLDGVGGDCLTATSLVVTGGMTGSKITAFGTVRMNNASVEGLSFRSAQLDGKGKEALNGANLQVKTGMQCDQDFKATGTVNLGYARIGGSLSFINAQLDGTTEALSTVRLDVSGDMTCANMIAEGTVNISGANIGGSLSLAKVKINGGTASSLVATSLNVSGDFFCIGMSTEGKVGFGNVNVGGSLLLSNSTMDGKGQESILGIGLKVADKMLCDGHLRASGTFNLGSAEIGSTLSLSGAYIDGKGETALNAGRIKVGQSMLCINGFIAKGKVELGFANIVDNLSFQGSSIDNGSAEALSGFALTVEGYLTLIKMSVKGTISLIDARIDHIRDDKESWPECLQINGLSYDSITNMPAKDRLIWLGRSSDYYPQPFEQLASYYRQLGSDREARHILLAKQRIARRQRPWVRRGWGLLQDALVGYGYAPGRALLILAVAFLGGWLLFRSEQPPPPIDPATHPVFNAAIYTLDVMVPVGGIGDASDWAAHGIDLIVASGLHILGWLLAITVIAAITRSFSRD